MYIENENENEADVLYDNSTKVKKAETWQEIFLRCPEFAYFIIDFYECYREEGLNDLVIMYNTNKKKFELGSLTPQPSDKFVEDEKKEEE